MKHLIFIGITLLFFQGFLLQGQSSDTLWNQTDARGWKQGYWRAYYDNGKLRYRGYFKDNQPLGEFRRYYESGGIMAVQNFTGQGTSYVTLYYENGGLAAQGKYVGQKRDSLWRYYSYYDKTLRMEENYRDGKLSGPSIKYYPNHRPAEIINWVDDKREGEWKQFFENGSIKLEAIYVNDKRNGYFRLYRPNGMPEVFGQFQDNLMEGEWVYFDEKGQGKIQIRYKKGEALNPALVDSLQQELIKAMDANQGKFAEPTEEDFFPGRR
ncbi:MAG TPA: toxin-antitoxin system YwqK family antitoxin [Bacteroidales bacterium]|nr:toxin-antitoxin system YwqK family antitoxin [Bacteroidales bacterium]HPO64718.1 toxin-antitoxin system YwqK family antitoxin [Bacteroidales bacterium]